MFGLMVTSSAWMWYQSSIAQYLKGKYHISATYIGLILMSTGLADLITSPVCGFILGKIEPTIWVHILGMCFICFGYTIFGSIPPMRHLSSIGMTIVSLISQGIGFSLSYIANFCSLIFSKDDIFKDNLIGSLLFMKREASERKTENADECMLTSQVSTFWLLSSNIGSYLGSLAGSAAIDNYGFSLGSAIEFSVLFISIVLMTVYAIVSFYLKKTDFSIKQGEESYILENTK